ncbi:ABC transporter substrate-binding protein [Cellulomonas sp. 179-A 4D5 NHS]|uniref:ABC transporter substrate-binding protein n=1 Tax=Cellulomonas sp. 179-A 4D5 NHS TaxID=3142378 RepID=UPI00399FC362
MHPARPRRRALALVAAAALLLTACSSGSEEPATAQTATPQPDEVEVFTWWASGSEKLGLDSLVATFAEQHPEITFVNGSVAGGGGGAAKDLLQSRLEANDPPDTFQAHAGAELTDYIEAGRLEDISSLYDEWELRSAFPEDLIERLTVDGKIYSIPSNIHRANVVWANPGVLSASGLDPEATYASIDEWIVALRAVAATGRTPLSIATTWTQVHLLETVLLAELGPDAYSGLWDGTTDWAGPQVRAAIDDFDVLLDLSNADRESLDWPDATQRVMDGQAAFNVMGDWAVAEFEDAGKVRGTDFTYFPVPGTQGVFDFLADSFVLPVGAPHPDGARAWLDTISSVDGQTAFNLEKGSIPARGDVSSSYFSDYQQGAMESFYVDRIVSSLAHGAAAPNGTLTAISTATGRFSTGATDAATFQAELAAAAQES